MPIITLEVMPDSMAETIPYDSYFPDGQQNKIIEEDLKDPNGIPFLMDKHDDSTGMHFLVNKSEPTEMNEQNSDDASTGSLNVRSDLMEYTTMSNGSVCCKVCGKILSSRTHWYRHKYRAHALHPVNPAPLFQCEQCLIYFKSRKGYIGHIASKHSETLQDASPVLTNAQAEALAKEKSIIQQHPAPSEPILTQIIRPEPMQLVDPVYLEPTQSDPMEAEVKKEPDPELSIPKTIVPTCHQEQATSRSTDTTSKRNTRSTRQQCQHAENDKEWKERRSREEKLVADIIARVRRECEEQASGSSTRRGYSRKSALHT